MCGTGLRESGSSANISLAVLRLADAITHPCARRVKTWPSWKGSETHEDVLLVAGDVSSSLDRSAETLSGLKELYDQVRADGDGTLQCACACLCFSCAWFSCWFVPDRRTRAGRRPAWREEGSKHIGSLLCHLCGGCDANARRGTYGSGVTRVRVYFVLPAAECAGPERGLTKHHQ